MKTEIIAFTDKGMALAETLAEKLGGNASRCGVSCSLQEWTEHNFKNASALVFVGAAGIAVRAIAPYIVSKDKDPAVVVIDECANFALSLLSGHLGGANSLARRIAEISGAQSVITTATDVNRVFSFDSWARENNLAVVDTSGIKPVSSRLLRGESVGFFSEFEIGGALPGNVFLCDRENCDVSLSLSGRGGELQLVPRVACLGIGCKKNTPVEKIESLFQHILTEYSISEKCFNMVSSIDIKSGEAGILAFCRRHSLEFSVFPAEKLAAAEGEFTVSDFVLSTVGVDNVCERSAVAGSKNGKLIIKKSAQDGVTMAVALSGFSAEWRS